MKRLKRVIKWTVFTILTVLIVSISTFLLYCNSFDQVNPTTIELYGQLKTELKKKGYDDKLLVISSKRASWHNNILTLFGASSKSRHLGGDAIDFMVLDVNGDGEFDSNDVDIVYTILDKTIIRNKGGLGTYKSEAGIWNRQMIHLDCRPNRTRWHR
jgi:uncharacterized protein YcbK (DUF882 family)